MFKKIKTWLNNGWEESEEVPNWIKNKKGKSWKGDNFLYKLENAKYYRKSRGLEYPEGIPKNKRNMKRWQKGNQIIYTPKDFRNPFEP